MIIDNNYKYKHSNFGSLKSIKYSEFYSELYSEELSKLLQSVKDSKAFNEFFKKYDVDMLIKEDKYTEDLNMILKATVPTNNGNNLYPKVKLAVNSKYFSGLYTGRKLTYTLSTNSLIDKLTEKVKNVTFSDLKTELDSSLKKLKEKENLNDLKQKHRAELDKIANSLLTEDSHEGAKEKNFIDKFFEKVLGWLLD